MTAYIGTQPYTKATRTVHEFTLNSGATTVQAPYVPTQLDVFLNGILLLESDYTATDGSTIVLNSPVQQNGSTLTVITYNSFENANHYSKAASDNRYVVSGADGSQLNKKFINSDTTLTEADSGKYIDPWTVPTGTLITLPFAGAGFNGGWNVTIGPNQNSLTIKNDSVNNVQSPDGSVLIPANGGTWSKPTGKGPELYLHEFTGSAQAFLTGRTIVQDAVNNNEAVALGQFGNSRNTNGYTYLPNGLIFQWVQTSAQSSPASNAFIHLSFTYPTPFPTAFLSAVVSPNGFAGGSARPITCDVESATNTGANVTWYYTGTSGPGAFNQVFNVFLIGY